MVDYRIGFVLLLMFGLYLGLLGKVFMGYGIMDFECVGLEWIDGVFSMVWKI